MRKGDTSKKRYGVLVLVMIANWLLLYWMLNNVDPNLVKDVFWENSYLPMLIVVFGSIFWLLTIMLLSTKRSLRWSLGITISLYLQVIDLGSPLNFLLIFSILLVVEYYLSIKVSIEQFKTLKNATITEQNKQDN